MLLGVLLNACSTSSVGSPNSSFTQPLPTSSLPSATISTQTSLPTATPLPKLPVSIGTPLPQGSVISSVNWEGLSLVGEWGLGMLTADFAWSPDDSLLAIPTTSGVHVFDPLTGTRVVSLPGISEGQFLGNEYFIGIYGGDTFSETNGSAIHVLCVSDGMHVRSIDFAGRDLRVSLDQSRFAVMDNTTGIVTVFRTKDFSIFQVIETPSRSLVSISPDGSMIATVDFNQPVLDMRFYEVESGALIRSFAGGFSISRQWTVVLTGRKESCFWQINTDLILSPIDCQPTQYKKLSPDGAQWSYSSAIFSRENGTILQIDLKNGVSNDFWSYREFSNSGSMLACVNGDWSLGVWDTHTGEQLSLMPNDFYLSGDSLIFSPSGDTIATGNYLGGQIRNARSGEWLGSFNGGSSSFGQISSLLFSPDGKIVYSNGVLLYNLSDFSETSCGAYSCAPSAFSRDGMLQSFTGKNIVTIRDTSNNFIVVELLPSGEAGPVYFKSSAFSPDSGLLAAGTGSGFYLWSIPRGELIYKTDEFGMLLYPVFSPDGRFLAFNSPEGVVVWNTQDFSIVLRSTDGDIPAFSPNGSLFVTSKISSYKISHSGEYRFWRTATWELVGILRPPVGDAFAFSPDGLFFMAGGERILVYAIQPVSWVEP